HLTLLIRLFLLSLRPPQPTLFPYTTLFRSFRALSWYADCKQGARLMMQPYYQDAHVTIYNADWRELKSHLEQNPVDAIITDPPYGLEEFAKGRDHGRSRLGRANFVDDGWDKESETSEAVYDMLKAAPKMLKKGGNLFSFGSFEHLGEMVEQAPKPLYYKTYGVWHKKNPIPINMKIRFVGSLESWVHWVNGQRTGTFNA